jgi:hypothetical protein
MAKTFYLYDRYGCYWISTTRTDARNAVTVKPPATKSGEVAKWNGKSWSIIEDHRRKQMWNAETGASVTVLQPGPIPEGWTLNKNEVDQTALKDQEVKRIFSEAEKMIADKYPIDYQVKVAAGIIQDEEMKTWIADVLESAKSKKNDIKQGKEPGKVWPEKPSIDLTPGINAKDMVINKGVNK